MLEKFGYLASAIIVGSFFFSDPIVLRSICSIGCAMFVIYGVKKRAIPVVVTNGLLCIVNIIQLGKEIL